MPKLSITIAGPSKSGKTRFAESLHQHLVEMGWDIDLLHLDDYYLPREQIQQDELGLRNWESMSAFDLRALAQKLSSGRSFILEGIIATEVINFFDIESSDIYINLTPEESFFRRAGTAKPLSRLYYERIYLPAYYQNFETQKVESTIQIESNDIDAEKVREVATRFFPLLPKIH